MELFGGELSVCRQYDSSLWQRIVTIMRQFAWHQARQHACFTFLCIILPSGLPACVTHLKIVKFYFWCTGNTLANPTRWWVVQPHQSHVFLGENILKEYRLLPSHAYTEIIKYGDLLSFSICTCEWVKTSECCVAKRAYKEIIVPHCQRYCLEESWKRNIC